MARFIFNIISSVWKAYWLLAYSFIISSAIYFSFYLLYLPKSHHVKQVHFSYSSNCEQKLGEGYCSFPEAAIQLHDSSKGAKDGLREKGTSQDVDVKNQVLSRGQSYNIQLELEVPESERNRDIGVFLVQIDLLNKSDEIIETSTRPVMLKHEHSLLSTISTWFYIVPLLMGLTEQKQTLDVLLVENFVDHSYNPITSIKLTLHSKYIQWYTAKLKISAIFTGIRYYMYNWPITFSLMCFLSIFSTITMVLLWRKLSQTPQPNDSQSFSDGISSISPYGDSSSDEEDEKEEVKDLDSKGKTKRARRRLVPKAVEDLQDDLSQSSDTDNQHVKTD